jgi:6-phosphofructokinase 2
MARILTLTLNPTIDVSTAVDEMVPVHKMRCGAVRRDPGGGGINVARVVRRLGSDVVATYPTGGLIGALLRKLTDEEGVQSRTVPIAQETRENFTVLDQETGEQFRFVLPGPELSEAEWRACLEAARCTDGTVAYIVASGSLPPGVPSDVFGVLAEIAQSCGARLVVDTTKPGLQAALKRGVHMIKPNLREMRDLMDEPMQTPADWIAAGRRLVAAGGVEFVALTVAEHGALLIGGDGAWHAKGLSVELVSAVGAGDSFLGAVVWALDQGHAPHEALRHGVAAGSAALLTPATGLCRKEDVERLLGEVEVTPL